MKYSHHRTTCVYGIPGLILYASFLLWSSCANPIPPTGGPKDNIPPKIIVEESTPNFLTSFNREEIILTFDEWIQLKEQNLQIVISPPLTYRHEITLKGKSVIIRFHEAEVLRAQTTYQINFGSSIADVNEGNVLDQYKYVFSTGTFIDSLETAGTVVDASTGEPAANVLVILHDDLSDSAIIKLRPSYFAKSGEDGRWTIGNVRSDTFNIYALSDLNQNYLYDQLGENIGFLGHTIFLPDTSLTRHRISLFEETSVLNVLDVDHRSNGITKVLLSRQSDLVEIRALDTMRVPPPWGATQDTLFIWNSQQDSFHIVVSEGALIIDTILVHRYRGSPPGQNSLVAVKRILHPSESLDIQSRYPIDRIDTSGILCLQSDSVRITLPDIQVDSLDRRIVHILHRWQEEARYRLRLPPGFVTDIYGSTHDTVNINLQISALSTFGQIFANVGGLSDSLQYVVQLVHPQSGVLSEHVIHGQTQKTVEFLHLQPQNYRIRIIEDTNRNGRWDTGDLLQQRQPERVYIQTLEPLRAGWDLEATILWQQK